uniref:SFRICE_001816 n=1 Tax=Spodoptera frugiperda TaxID=7108 RepID=A0A2H1V5P6_SPOFR
MESTTDKDWKKNLGFPINYNSASSDDEFDIKDVVFRNPRHSSKYLLADSGDGSEADLLGTTPPRSRIRDKERGRNTYKNLRFAHDGGVDLDSNPVFFLRSELK